MVIHPRTKSVMVALAHLLAPTRRPSLALSLSLPDASKHKHVALASPGRASPAIPRHERKRAQKSRSFRRRQAPITRGQKRTLRELWPKYGLLTDFNARWKFEEIFPTPGAVNFDIGFGCGESLIGMAMMRPDENFVGIEVHKPGVATALAQLEAEGLSNVKIVQGDAITVLADHVEDGALSSCCIFFPDPFPQDKDSGRRLVRPLLLSLLSSKIRPGGLLHVATDVEVYAEHTARVVAGQNSRSPTPRDFTEEKEAQSPLSRPFPSRQPPTAATATTAATTRTTTVAGAIVAAGSVTAGEGERLGNPEDRKKRRAEQVFGANPVADACGPQRQQAGSEGQSSSRPSAEELSVHWKGGETAQRPASRPLTKYEEKAREAGRRVRDFKYRLELPPAASRPHAADAY